MLMNNSDPLTAAIANKATDPPGQAVVFLDTAAEITLTLTNNTGSAIPLTAGTSTVTVFMTRVFTAGQIGAMTVTATDWEPKLAGGWELRYKGTATELAEGGTVVITIGNVVATGQQRSSSLQINPVSFGPLVPPQTTAPLSVNKEPVKGNAILDQTLNVSLNSQGTVFVSTAADPLPNTLFLNLKNTNTKEALYTGKTKWPGKPYVNVTFVYGSTAGALAPNDDPNAPAAGSAWNIEVGISVGTGWQATKKNENSMPVFELKPTDTNIPILGTGEAANVTFSFSNIQSFLAPGHTQMIVQFAGFFRSETQAYDDEVFVVDISKQTAPPTRGLVNFFGGTPLETVMRPDQPIPVKLQWAMFDVPKVRLLVSYPGMARIDKPYPNFPPVNYDHREVTIPGVSQSGPIIFTMQALDGKDNYLNSMQFAVYVQADMFFDPRDNQVYAAILVGRTLWMAQNLNYRADDSYNYNNDGSNAATYGRVYSIAAAQDRLPPGWRLPALADWVALINAFGGQGTPGYNALIAGGSAQFNAQLGGSGYKQNGQMQWSGDFASFGYYWTATPGQQGGSQNYVQFTNKGAGSVSTGAAFPNNYYVSVRYVKDI